MKQLLSFCMLTLLYGSANGQSGWFQIYPGTVEMYSAPSRDTIFAVSGDRLHRSDNSGVTWSFVCDWPIETREEQGQLIVKKRVNYLKFGTSQFGIRSRITESWSEGVVHYDSEDEVTSDGGVTWTNAKVWSSNYSPATSAYFSPGMWITARSSGNSPFFRGGVSFSFDSGRTWPRVTNMISFNSSFHIVRSDLVLGPASYTVDSGASWHPMQYSTSFVVTPHRLWRFSMDSSFVSVDDGATWLGTAKDSISPYYTDRRGVVIGKSAHQWHLSIDSGQSYTPLTSFSPQEHLEVMDRFVLYALSQGKLLKSTTTGQQLSVTDADKEAELSIFPNPAGSIVACSEHVQWSDLLGRQVNPNFQFDGLNYRYDVRGLQPAAYIVRYKQASRIVIIQR